VKQNQRKLEVTHRVRNHAVLLLP